MSTHFPFHQLRHANQVRQRHWPGGEEAKDELFRATEFGEEAGEVLGAVKKLTRDLRGIGGNKEVNIAARRMHLMEEVGDVMITLDLLTNMFDIDIADCVAMKFNKTSDKVGVPVYMDPENWDTVVVGEG